MIFYKVEISEKNKNTIYTFNIANEISDIEIIIFLLLEINRLSTK